MFDLFHAMTGAEDSESCENRNGAASALLHIDESDGIDDINRQRNKSRRRSEPRQVQTGENSIHVWTLQRFGLFVIFIKSVTLMVSKEHFFTLRFVNV